MYKVLSHNFVEWDTLSLSPCYFYSTLNYVSNVKTHGRGCSRSFEQFGKCTFKMRQSSEVQPVLYCILKKSKQERERVNKEDAITAVLV